MALTPRAPDTLARHVQGPPPPPYQAVGALFVVPPGQTVQFRSSGAAARTLSCRIDPEALDALFGAEFDWRATELGPLFDVSSPRVRAPLARLARELLRPGFASGAMIDLQLAQVAVQLGRHYQAVAPRGAWARGGLPAWRLRLVDQRLAEAPAPTLDELAGLCAISVRQFTRSFRISRGCSLGEYMVQQRMIEAKRLLMTGQSMEAISRQLRFKRPASFSSAFHRFTGMTPRHFRKLGAAAAQRGSGSA